MGVEMSIEGIAKFTDELELIQRKMPDKAIVVIDRQANRIVREYRKMVKPIRRTGNLSRRMRPKKAHPDGHDWVGGVKSYAPHFHLVEYGHRMVPRGASGQRKKKSEKEIQRQSKKFVRGKYYLKKSCGLSERLFTKDIDKMIEEGMDVLSR